MIDQVSGSQRDHFSHFVRHRWHIDDLSGLGWSYLVLSAKQRWLLSAHARTIPRFLGFSYFSQSGPQSLRYFCLSNGLERLLLSSRCTKGLWSLGTRLYFSQNKQIWTAEINHPNFEEGLSFNRSSVSQVKDFNIKTNSMWRQKSMFHVLYGIFSVDKVLLVDK